MVDSGITYELPASRARRGERVIVTGAAGRIGAAVATRFHREGASVIVVDMNDEVETLASSLGDRAKAYVFDITDPEPWNELTETSGVDVLVNSAGVLGPALPVAELALAEWQRVLHVNVTGVFVPCRAVIPGMITRGSGRIVTMASIAGKEGNPLQSAYSASKGAVIAFTKSLAREVATSGVSVNCVAPTIVDGPFADAMSVEQRDAIRAKIPMDRFCDAREVAAMIAWVASPECSFTTGFCFDLSGGRATF